METIGQKMEDGRLTQGDLALAAYSLAQLHNAYLDSLERGDYKEEMTEEQMHTSIQSIHTAHAKFDAILSAMRIDNEATAGDDSESKD
tara:strand:+ start:217 stop:480 length:264 start_codon:yes stop_codon:yes gene_type:complete